MTLNQLMNSPEPTLRLVLRTNAATSGLGGLAALAAGGPLDDLLGTGQVGLVRVVGAGLVLFALGVVVVSRLDREGLIRHVPGISLGDASWVVGTVAAIGRGWFSTGGAVTMAAVAVMVGVFGIEQAVLVHRLGARANDAANGGSISESRTVSAALHTRRR